MDGLSRSLPARSYAWLASAASFVVAVICAWGRHGIYTSDTTAAAIPAWLLVHRQQIGIPQDRFDLELLGEIVARHGSLYSNRPIGMILASAPGQLFTSAPTHVGDAYSAALVSAFSVWAAFRLWGPKLGALAALGTPLLYVVGKTLWPETVCVALLLGSLLVVRAGRSYLWLVPVVCFATMCRLPFGVLLALILAILARRRRDVVPPIVGLAAGLAVLLLYSHAVFGQWSFAAGYPTPHEVLGKSLWVGLVSPARGLIWWSPWLLFVRFRRDRWSLVVALAAAYTIASWLTFDAWGGSGWVGYRYPVPLAILAVPLVRRPAHRLWRPVFDLAVIWAVSMALVGEVVRLSRQLDRVPSQTGLPIAQALAIFASIVLLSFLVQQLRLRAGQRAPAHAP